MLSPLLNLVISVLALSLALSRAIFAGDVLVYARDTAPSGTDSSGANSTNSTGSANSTSSANSTHDVIIQMFQWTWDSIAAECTAFIGPAGYGYVQASPAQEHITGDDWWTDYQPVSYNITSKRGDRTKYKNMIDTCHSAGVKVIADTIFNHMAAQESGAGIAGSTFTHYNYPGIYDTQDFHHCGLSPGDKLDNFDDRQITQTCEFQGLADLATESEHVRARLAEHANDLLSLGVDGFRLDSAKLIAASDIADITSRFTSKPYITQEVTWSQGEPVTPSEYVNIGFVQEFGFTALIRDAFQSGNIAGLQNFDSQGWIPSDVANVFVADHDTERNGESLNHESPSNIYTLANIFSLAHPYGQPTVLSSYADINGSIPLKGAGSCSGSNGTNGWLCQHRWPAIAGMVGFRNAVRALPSNDLTKWTSPSAQQIAFARGTAGFVAINNGDTDWTMQFDSGLPPASYCDVVQGTPNGTACAGQAFSVSASGSFSATVPARSAIAIHIGAVGNGSGNGGSGNNTGNSTTMSSGT